jgi:hypothetical protein
MFEYAVLWVEFEQVTRYSLRCASVWAEVVATNTLQQLQRKDIRALIVEWPRRLYLNLRYVRPSSRLPKRNKREGT